LLSLFNRKQTELFIEAEKASRSNIYRQGDYVVLPPTGDTMISGDIHGNMENFDLLMEIANLKRNPKRHLVVHELVHNIHFKGAMKDQSKDILVWAAELKCEFPNNFHYVTGNHELAEIQGKGIMKDGIKIPLVFGTANQKKRRMGDYGSPYRTAAINFLRSLLIGIRHRGGIWMSHSIPSKAMHQFSLSLFDGKKDEDELATMVRSQRAYKEEVLEDLTWGRDFSNDLVNTFKDKVKAKVLIIGHEYREKGWDVPHKDMIILDTTGDLGAYMHIRNDKAYTHKEALASIQHLNKHRR
jgi:hypothetical protein